MFNIWCDSAVIIICANVVFQGKCNFAPLLVESYVRSERPFFDGQSNAPPFLERSWNSSEKHKGHIIIKTD
jgi:hypothetical protein